MTDDEKHEWCRRRTGHHAVILMPTMYDEFERHGYDMRWYVRSQPIPETET